MCVLSDIWWDPVPIVVSRPVHTLCLSVLSNLSVAVLHVSEAIFVYSFTSNVSRHLSMALWCVIGVSSGWHLLISRLHSVVAVDFSVLQMQDFCCVSFCWIFVSVYGVLSRYGLLSQWARFPFCSWCPCCGPAIYGCQSFSHLIFASSSWFSWVVSIQIVDLVHG